MKISYRNTIKVDIFSSLLMTKHAEIKILRPLYWIPSTVLMLSPQCTEYPPQYWSYPPLYWCYPPTVLNNLHSTEGIPPQYWSYPPQYWRYPSTVLKLSPTVLKVSLHSTEYPPQYWCYPPACTDVIPPLYWTTSTVLKLSPHSTKAIPHCTEQPPQYWSYPSQYWCYPPDVLNNLQCTEPTLYGVWISPAVKKKVKFKREIEHSENNVVNYSDTRLDLEHTSPALKKHEICLNFRKTSKWKFRIVIKNCWYLFVIIDEQTCLTLNSSPTVLSTPSPYWCYPPMYWLPFTVLKLSPPPPPPHCSRYLPTCTPVIPPQYWC